ncbi:MAG: hypothetical protein ACOH2V_07940 [Candidatus Saccharimonadaceae bacterium]
MKNILLYTAVLIGFLLVACSRPSVDITTHQVNPEADVYYQKALELGAYYDLDSTNKTLQLLDTALIIDNLNPDYYGLKAKLLSELGNLDSALVVQELAYKHGAITGEYLFQLGLFQAAKDKKDDAKKSFKRSNENLKAVLVQYPDSLGAFILQQAANALYMEQDSLFMTDVPAIRERFSDRLMEIEMKRRLKPHNLIKQLKEIQKEALFPSDAEMNKLIEEAMK